MQRVKHFSKKHMIDIENEINDFIEKNNIKIINIALTTNTNAFYKYHALVTYEIN